MAMLMDEKPTDCRAPAPKLTRETGATRAPVISAMFGVHFQWNVIERTALQVENQQYAHL
jgi:hypothetical protein